MKVPMNKQVSFISFFVFLGAILFYSIWKNDIKRTWEGVKKVDFVVDSISEKKQKVYITFLDYNEKHVDKFDLWTAEIPAVKGNYYFRKYDSGFGGYFVGFIGFSLLFLILGIVLNNLVFIPYNFLVESRKSIIKENIVKGKI
jgi:hypothetical protein